MKKLTLIVLGSILLTSCTFAVPDILPQAPAQPAGTATPIPPTDTATSNLPPTFTLTPTFIGGKPSSTPTDTPLPTNTFLLVTLPTDTPEPPTAAPTSPITGLEGTGFDSVDLSNTDFHWGSCDPNKTTMTVRVTDPGQVFSVVVFVKFRNKSTGKDTGWDEGSSMEDQGSGRFTFTFDGNLMGVYADSWVVYQLVATDTKGNNVARSPVFPDKLSLLHCP